MKKQEQSYLMQMAPEDRVKILQDTADKVEVTSYLRSLTPEDLEAKRELFSDNAIKIDQWADELQAVKDEYKMKTKPVSDANRLLLSEIKTKQEMVTGKVYHAANFDSGFMETFDERDELIGTRKLRPDERQPNMFIQKQA